MKDLTRAFVDLKTTPPLPEYSLHSDASSSLHSPQENPGSSVQNSAHTFSSGSTPPGSSSSQQARQGRKASVWELGGLTVVELGKRVYRNMLAHDCLGQAAQLAYYFLFALFPFLLFLTTLLGYIPIPNLLDYLMTSLSRALPGEALDLVRAHILSITSQQRSGLLSFGILAAVWTASSAILAIMSGLNRAYQVEESRPWWKVRGIAFLLVLGLSLFMIGATALLIFGPQLGNFIAVQVRLGNVFTMAWNILQWPVSIILLMIGMAVLYYFAPDVEQEWRWVTPGSVFAVIGWIVASLGFSFYATNFSSYNVTYGSIGAVIVLLTWLYLAAIFILVGGEVNAEIEHASLGGKAPGERRSSAPGTSQQ